MNEKRIDELIIQLQQGNMEAFDEFYELTKKGVYSMAYQILKSRDEAENVLQDTYLKFLEKLPEMKKDRSVLAYLMQTSKNLSLNIISKDRRILHQVDITSIPEEEKSQNDDEVMRKMREVLSAEENQIVLMHCLYDMSHKEIANEIHKPIGTVTWKYNQAIKKLKEALIKDGYRE